MRFHLNSPALKRKLNLSLKSTNNWDIRKTLRTFQKTFFKMVLVMCKEREKLSHVTGMKLLITSSVHLPPHFVSSSHKNSSSSHLSHKFTQRKKDQVNRAHMRERVKKEVELCGDVRVKNIYLNFTYK